MSIVVSIEQCCNVLTIYANSCRLSLSIGDAYALLSHLRFTLDELAIEQVMEDRRNFISGAYAE